MTPEKVLEVVGLYRLKFTEMGIPKERIDPKRSGPFYREESLAHAHYLLDGIQGFSREEENWGTGISTWHHQHPVVA